MPKRTFHRLDDDKKERVIRAAIEEFQTCGFENAKIEAIIRGAGVAKGSIYQYSDDEKELFPYCVTWALEYFMKAIDRQTSLQDMDVYDYFLSGDRERFELLRQEPLLVAFPMETYTSKFGSLALEASRELSRIGEEYELRLIVNGKRKGTVRDDLDDRTLLLFFQGITKKFDAEIMEKVRSVNYNPTEEQYCEMEHVLKNMISLLRQGMGRNWECSLQWKI